jgi:hypothetical protein
MIYLVSKAGMHIGESCEHGRALCASYAELECVRHKAVESALALTMPDEAMIVGCQVAAQLRSLGDDATFSILVPNIIHVLRNLMEGL